MGFIFINTSYFYYLKLIRKSLVRALASTASRCNMSPRVGASMDDPWPPLFHHENSCLKMVPFFCKGLLLGYETGYQSQVNNNKATQIGLGYITGRARLIRTRLIRSST